MYGMLLESIQYFIQSSYGEDKWMMVLEHAGMKNEVFSTHTVYPDNSMHNIASACSEVLKDGTVDEYLQYFGKCFVKFFSHYGYDKIVRVSGRYYCDFLHGIDNLHEMLRFGFPKLITPSFCVEQIDKKGCVLNYVTKRFGFTHYVVGQLQAIGKKFYGLDVDVKVISEKKTSPRGLHVKYRLNFENSVYCEAKSISSIRQLPKDLAFVRSDIFFKVFPFSLVFGCDMVVTKIGRCLQKLFPGDGLVDQPVSSVFKLRRPIMAFSWENVLLNDQKLVFELESRDAVHRHCKHTTSCTCPSRTASQHLLLKGQMRYIEDWKEVVYLCSPMLSNLTEMQGLGLFINDLNMFDSSRDMVIAGAQHASKIEMALERQVEEVEHITDNMKKLDEWKQKSESLLYSMIPKSIAVRLKNGEDPINTCEVFDSVTIGFSYLIGFTEVCAHVSAMESVQVINSAFTLFDSVSDKYKVFKVETLGDAVYMVAGGVPDREPNHAANVAHCVLELLEKVKTLRNPDKPGNHFLLRAGMHTGGIVAGVVGKRMPQYCLFGDTVNTAARMQTHGAADQIHVSETCKRCLDATEFNIIPRGTVSIKGKGTMNTYWLAGVKNGSTDKEEADNTLKSHLEVAGKKELQRKSSFPGFDLHALTHAKSCSNMNHTNGVDHEYIIKEKNKAPLQTARGSMA
ncbi:soluble guanylate cyclase 88E [Lingula anatina]|uniref:guanylate cyclase n=1 Tax=Lingula anatina TaxID=7574 RepID=A0A1S3JSG3_LINAN|nr:soluble guanylate cyclase 88E [Lingula anatina]|eukprot:XP_013413325.1 soluble guanylate cyclase 88E [Lingula anatina]